MDRRQATRNLAIALHDFAEVILDELESDAADEAVNAAVVGGPPPAPSAQPDVDDPPHGFRRNAAGVLERV